MDKKKKVLVAGAWVYANGSLHIGHLASLLPGDVIARYHRAIGNEVCYVSGSDCHGTPVSIRARAEQTTPEAISDFYHKEFKELFEKLGFSYDGYDKTSSEHHKKFVTEFHKRLYQSSYVNEREVPQVYCPKCEKVLTDRLVLGKCPVCGVKTRGDQCDACGAVLEAENLIEPYCSVCHTPTVLTKSKHLYIEISKLEKELTAYLESHPEWRKNAIAFTRRYIEEGLKDRALTRDLDWGIDVPKAGYEDKKIYIWAENVLGYLSVSEEVCEKKGLSFEELWGKDALHYYVHGKGNIPFHTIILPSLLLAEGSGYHLPDKIISSEYITLEGEKISTSKNWAIWVKDLVNRYDPDSLRYFFLINGPEKRDTDFSWREYVTTHNSELLGAYGNLVNRTLAFLVKYRDGILPDGVVDAEIKTKIEELYGKAGKKIEEGEIRSALEDIFEFIRFGNQYFDKKQPWKTRTEDEKACDDTLYQCVQIIGNAAVLLAPFLPFSSEKVLGWLQLTKEWEPKTVAGGVKLPEISILFSRLDKSVIEEEKERLKAQKKKN
ncbi:MAG: methionine--tRNA ligase [Lachnospiraceae bacterium]|nr:methionine--tRNA ligase [Lachnospiraceae bacterium]